MLVCDLFAKQRLATFAPYKSCVASGGVQRVEAGSTGLVTSILWALTVQSAHRD